MAKITGRRQEIALLKNAASLDRSVFVAVYGRRRVGKTYLIRNVYEDGFVFQLTGIANVGTAQQLVNFQSALVRYFPEMEDRAMPEDWFQAFRYLMQALESVAPEGKKRVFIDELPWLDTPGSMFIAALEHFWNSWASARSDIVLIVCGSAASWMVHQLIDNTGGLYNRITHRVHLEPFTLAECAAFFKEKSPGFDRYQLLQLYMVLGGIPFYLEAVDPAKSASQNINDLCFSSRGLLRTEFSKLYASIFSRSERHVAIVEALAKKSRGMERADLLKAAKIPNGGNATTVLQELEESNFIRKYRAFGKQKNKAIYQLADFYSLFYIKFIKAHAPYDDDFWINGLDKPDIRAWSGYAFELVCLAHLRQIKAALGIAGVQTQSSAWVGGNDTESVQVDLVIDRRDQVVNLCEMKFSIQPYQIDNLYAAALRKKIGVFRDATKTTKAVWLTFITTHGLVRNQYAQALVHNALTMDALFEKD
jgi:hypothetical protein